MQMMQMVVDIGEDLEFHPDQISEVAGLLKSWIRDLPEPLIPSSV